MGQEHVTVHGPDGSATPGTAEVRSAAEPALQTEAALETTRPAAVELACLVSLAVRIEPELLRAVRLDAAPHLGAAAEADLWFSRLVASRGPDAISLVAEVREVLRRRLAAHPDPATVRRAWAAVERMHVNASPALVLEERIAHLTVLREPGWRTGVQRELDRALATLAQRPVPSVARWAVRAVPRLPAEVQAWPAAVHLKEAAGELTLVHGRGGAGDGAVQDLDMLVRERPTTELRIRRAGSRVYLGDIGGDRAVAVEVPDTDPRLVELRWEERGDSRPEQVAVRNRDVAIVAVGPGPVRLRALGGAVYELPPPQRPRVAVVHQSGSPVAERLAKELHSARGIEFVLPSGAEARTPGSGWRTPSAVPAVPHDADGWVILVSTDRPAAAWPRLDWQDPQRTAPLLPVLVGGSFNELPAQLSNIQALDLRPFLRDWPRSAADAAHRVEVEAERVLGRGGPPTPRPSAGPRGEPPTSAPSGRRWLEVAFRADGRLSSPGAERLLDQVDAQGATDLLMFVHGWNQDLASARSLYSNFFGLLDRAREEWLGPRRMEMVYVGALWPSVKWSEDPDEADALGPGPSGAGRRLVEESMRAFPGPEQQSRLDELGDMFDKSADDAADLERSRELLADLAAHPAASAEVDPSQLLEGDATEVFERFAQAGEPSGAGTGGRGFRSSFGRLWDGAKSALRVMTYFEMSARAETIGEVGLGPLLALLSKAVPDVRVHLVAHSMGARLATSALARVPAESRSSLGSLVLLQAALPAASPPIAAAPSGDVSPDAVRGPCVATYSRADSAMGRMYPLLSRMSGAGGGGAEAVADPYEALGGVGFRGVQPHEFLVAQPAGAPYPFRPGWFYSVDCTRIVSSHSDIRRPEIAWLTVAAASAIGGP
jgi:hypothetical protein